MLDFQDLPTDHGAYVLHLSLAQPQLICIGRLGLQQFSVGDYVYSGSARGAGGLRARVNRHLRGSGIRHWHIDYLCAVAQVQDVFYTVTDNLLECLWSQAVARLPQAFIPVPRFGSSDCQSGCKAHLVALTLGFNLASIQTTLSFDGTISLVQLGRS